MVPPAPGRFSTSTGWPSAADNLSLTLRAMMSVALPGVNGTTMRTGFVGKVCAAAFSEKNARTIKNFISILRAGVLAGGLGKERLHDLQARDVGRRIHVKEDRSIAEELLDAEVQHRAVPAVQLHGVLG